MGGLVKGLFGDSGAPSEAAGAQVAQIQEAIRAIQSQQGITTANLDPFLRAGTGALPGVQQASTIGGFGQRIGELSRGGALQPLIDERTRGVQGALSAGGLTRSGTAVQELAAVPQDILFAIEQMLSQRGTNLANLGQQTGVQLGQFGANAASNIANLQSGIGAVQGAGILGTAEARAGQAGAIAGGFGDLFKAGASAGLFGAGGAGGVDEFGNSFFSDPRLKENVEEISRIPVDQGHLRVVQWDWKPITKGTIIEKYGNIGFMADEVKEFFPEFVGSYGGFDVINYPRLLKRLEVMHGSN